MNRQSYTVVTCYSESLRTHNFPVLTVAEHDPVLSQSHKYKATCQAPPVVALSFITCAPCGSLFYDFGIIVLFLVVTGALSAFSCPASSHEKHCTQVEFSCSPDPS